MRLFLKILKITVILIIIGILGLFTASVLMQDKVAGYILRSLNESLSTKYEFETVRLSLLRQFPKASLDLRKVVVHSSPGFDKSGFPGINTDTLLAADIVFIEFSISDIYKGIYNIDRIGIKDGILNLLTDSEGYVNYDITVRNKEVPEREFTLDLRRISLTDVETKYYNRATELVIEGSIGSGHLKSSISGKDIDFTAQSGMQITDFRLYNTVIPTSFPVDIDLSLSRSDSGIVFNKSFLDIDAYRFRLSGTISPGNILDLSLSGEDLDIEEITKYLPDEIINLIADYDPSGLLQVDGIFKGQLKRTSYPGIDIKFHLSDGSVTLLNKEINLNGLSFTGSFTNGENRLPETSRLDIENLSGTLGSTQYSGSLTVCNFDSLYGTLQLKGKVLLQEIKDFFRIKAISSSNGIIDLDLEMDGSLPGKGKYSLSAIMDRIINANLLFNNFSLGIKDDKFSFDNVNGRLFIADSIQAENLQIGFNNHIFVVNGIFKNLPEWLSGQPALLIASAGIRSGRIAPELLFPSLYKSDTASKRDSAFLLPGSLILDLDFVIDTFRLKKFKADEISGSLSYKPGLVNFKTLNMNSLDGVITCNGFIFQNSDDRSFNTRGNFDIENVNIKSAFESFNNFGQGFLTSENINGNLSGSMSVIIPLDSLLHVDVKSITAEGKYTIIDGALIDFEPVKQLSSFIELSELENIRFEKLENNIFIRSNALYIPQMDVNSSAADLSVNGKHGFDNDYEYHVRILLSEILSRKLKKPRPNTTEFGAVEDDGLGRTSVLLKIEDREDEVKVGYDVKAARNIVRDDIRDEKQTLRTILNEEYGWFKNDTTIVEKPEERTTPRFRILWEETDTLSNETDEELPTEDKKENPLRNLFKRKR